MLNEFEPTVIVMDIEGAEEDILPLVVAKSVRGMMVELHPHIIGVRHVNKLIEQKSKLRYEKHLIKVQASIAIQTHIFVVYTSLVAFALRVAS